MTVAVFVLMVVLAAANGGNDVSKGVATTAPYRRDPCDWFASLRKHLMIEPAESLTLASVIGRRFPEYPMYLTDG